MTPTIAEEHMTAAEFLKKYGHCSGVELVRGKVVWAGQEEPNSTGGLRMPEFKHGVICVRAAGVIQDFIKPLDLGWVAINDTYVTVDSEKGTVRGADVLYVSYKRLPKGPIPDDLPVAPELVIEVRSPSDRLNRLSAKATEYLNAGVIVVVVLDPVSESAAVFRLDEFPQRFSNGDELTLPDVLPGFSVPVRTFFE